MGLRGAVSYPGRIGYGWTLEREGEVINQMGGGGGVNSDKI